MDQNNFLAFIFPFRLTFSDTTTWNGWYQSEIMFDKARRWPFEVVGLAFPISAILIFLGLSSLLHVDSQSFLNSSIVELVGGALMTLLAAGMAGTAPEFGSSPHSLFT